jgi:hypothetical protein
MNNNDELSIESDQIALRDTAGMDEIAEAIKEIERLKNGGAPKEEIQEEQEDDVEPEEEQEEEKEEPQEQEAEEEEEPESKKAPKKLDKIWKIKRSRYKALAEKKAVEEEKKAVEEENARLKEMLAESLNSGTYHYGKNVYSELEKAKESKRRAIEEGDIDASIEADINLNRAINNINELEKWTASERQPQREPQRQQEHQKSADDYDEIEREKAADWLDDHPELQPNSRQYNLGLATEVSQFIHHLDNGIEARGQRDLLYSEEYFDTIDRYIHDVNNRDRTEKKRKSLGSVGHVGSVRNSYGNANGKSSKTIQMTLTADEKKICAAGGISEKDWLKYKLEELQKGK